MKGKRRRPANKLQSPGTGEVHHVCQSVLRTASYTHPPQGRPAGQHRPGPLGSLAVWPVDHLQPAHQPFPALIFYGTVRCQVLLDGWTRPSPDPYGPSETNLPCACPATLLELGLLELLGREPGEDLRTGGACRDVIIIIMAGSACSNRYLVPSVCWCWCLLHAARHCKWGVLASANGIIPQRAMKSK